MKKAFYCSGQGCWFFLLQTHGLAVHILVAHELKQKFDRSVSIDLETHQQCRLTLLQKVIRRVKRTKTDRGIVCSSSSDSSANHYLGPCLKMDSSGPRSPTRSPNIEDVHRRSEDDMILQHCKMFLDLK